MALQQDEAQIRSENLLRDAEDALRREQLRAFWQQWGSTLIGMAVMLVIGTAAGVAWREWRTAQNEKSTAALISLVNAPAQTLSAQNIEHIRGPHAAIAYLTQAGAVEDLKGDAARAKLDELYGAAADAGDDTVWGWLGRWNTLRLRMDDEKQDPAKLIDDYEDLADDMGKSSLAALPYTDAAIIAGEKMKNPEKALKYIAHAEKHVPRATPMAAIIADLKHLYEIRAQAGKDDSSQAEKAQ